MKQNKNWPLKIHFWTTERSEYVIHYIRITVFGHVWLWLCVCKCARIRCIENFRKMIARACIMLSRSDLFASPRKLVYARYIYETRWTRRQDVIWNGQMGKRHIKKVIVPYTHTHTVYIIFGCLLCRARASASLCVWTNAFEQLDRI